MSDVEAVGVIFERKLASSLRLADKTASPTMTAACLLFPSRKANDPELALRARLPLRFS